ncbi:unnamed protein product [Arctogadus glacialis]
MFIEPSASTTIARLTHSLCYSHDSSYCSCYTVKYYNTIQYNTVYNGCQKGEGGYAVEVDSEQVNLESFSEDSERLWNMSSSLSLFMDLGPRCLSSS